MPQDKEEIESYIEKGYQPGNEGYQPSPQDIIPPSDSDPQSGYQPETGSGDNPSNEPSAPGDE